MVAPGTTTAGGPVGGAGVPLDEALPVVGTLGADVVGRVGPVVGSPGP